jgi:hypothetical protein
VGINRKRESMKSGPPPIYLLRKGKQRCETDGGLFVPDRCVCACQLFEASLNLVFDDLP